MKFLPAIFLISIPMLLFSQNYKLNQRYPGYFINAKDDTIRGYILLINKLDNQMGTEYSNDSRGEKIKFFLMADDVKGFKVQDRIYTSVVYGDPDPKPQHFLLTLAEGDIKLYQYFRLAKDLYVGTGSGQRPANGDDEQYLQAEYILMKSGEQYAVFSQNSLLKHAEDIFKDDPALLQRVKEKEKGYRYNDLPEIIAAFNQGRNQKIKE